MKIPKKKPTRHKPAETPVAQAVKSTKKPPKNGQTNGKHLNSIGPKLNGANGHSLASGPQLPAPHVQADRQLIDRALSGDTTAWEDLYAQCHRPLVTAIRAMLRGRAADTNLVDELAARVWYAVVREQGELLKRFDPHRGCRLTTYLATIARDEAGRLFRSERRRRRREAASCDNPTLADAHASKAGQTSVTLSEFEATLTPSERKFYDEITLPTPTSTPPSSPPASTLNPHSSILNPPSRSQANLWQLSHRVRRKLERFLDG